MVIDDNLVKLASLGAAGISILAILITGIIIMRLPDNVSREKVKILYLYIISCIFFVILSTGSGIANALFNKEKIDEKQVEVDQVTKQYEKVRKEWFVYKRQVNDNLSTWKSRLKDESFGAMQFDSNIDWLKMQTDTMKFPQLMLEWDKK